MKETNPIDQLIVRYCQMKNKENKGSIIFQSLIILPLILLSGAFLYWSDKVGVFPLVLFLGICVSLVVFQIHSLRQGLGKLQTEYYIHQHHGVNTKPVKDDFLLMFAEDEGVPEYAKKRLARELNENNGQVYWHHVFVIRDELKSMDLINKKMQEEGARKLNGFTKG